MPYYSTVYHENLNDISQALTLLGSFFYRAGDDAADNVFLHKDKQNNNGRYAHDERSHHQAIVAGKCSVKCPDADG